MYIYASIIYTYIYLYILYIYMYIYIEESGIREKFYAEHNKAQGVMVKSLGTELWKS